MTTFFTNMRDGLKNILSGRGTSADKRSHNFWFHNRMPEDQIEAAYRSSWLIRKIIDLPAEDMTREWRKWQLKPDERKKIEKEERRLKVEQAILDGLVYGRLGGGVVILGTDGDMASEPRDGEELLYLKALPRGLVDVGEYDWDIGSSTFFEPKYFRLHGSRSDDVIHPERVIVFKGERVPGLQGQVDELGFWGDSVVEVVDQAVKNVDSSADGFAALVEEAKVDIYKLAQLADTLMQDGGEAKVRARVELTNMAKSNYRAVFLDAEDDWEQKQINWAGMPDLIRAYMNIAAGAADIPATRLYGKAPDGQNSTGESDDRNYRSMIMTKQNRVVRPALEKVDRFMLPQIGIAPETEWEWRPLSTPTEKEQAEIDDKRAKTADTYSKSGLIPQAALAKGVQSALVEAGTYPSLGEELEKLPEDELVPPEENETDPSEFTDPTLAGQGGALTRQPATRLAANDAAPRSLYIMRPVRNAADIIRWARKQGFDSTIAPDDMHVTIAFSRKPVDWMDVDTPWNEDKDGNLTIPAGGARIVEALGDKGAVVLMFGSSELSWRHESIKRVGASWDHDGYNPHVTLTYQKPADMDLKAVEPYRGPILLGPEIFDEVDEEWADKIEEA